MSVPLEIRTRRLLLRQWREDDLEPLAAILADPDVMRYIRGRPMDRTEAEGVFERRRGQWERAGFGFWAVEPLETGRLAGWTGLQHPDWLPDLSSETEIGWMLERAQQGKGLATEAATAALAAGFEGLRLPRVIGLHHPDNRASERVMEKLGMTFLLDTVDPREDGGPVRVRAITRERWRDRLEYAVKDE